MDNTISVLGLITARSGSKGVSNKNAKELLGKPLITYTCEAVNQSKLLTRTIISTDSEDIANIAKELGVDVPFMRPEVLATDNAKSIDVVQHALMWLKENDDQKFDYVMILQPTSPLRTAEDIDACIRIAKEKDADSVMSMVELTDMSLPKLKKIEDDRIMPLFEEEGDAPLPRNESESIYKRNTAIYLTKTELLMKGDMFGETSYPYIMPFERSIDINEHADFELAEFFLGKQ